MAAAGYTLNQALAGRVAHICPVLANVGLFPSIARGRWGLAQSGTYTQIVYAPSGSKLALMNGQTLQKAYVPLPGGGTAVYASSGLTYYRHPDQLGNARLVSTPSQGIYSKVVYAPYGEVLAQSMPTPDLSFTGQNQDTAAGLYDFLFREYHPVSGRWISPDPAALAALDLTNPQSLNRYAYVGNNPCSRTDPLGLAECDFNVQFFNEAGLSNGEVTAIQQRINQIFGAVSSPSGDTVGIKFDFSGAANTALTVWSGASWFTNWLWGSPMGTQGGFWDTPNVYMKNLPTGFSAAETAVMAGSVGAHELAHVWLGGDLNYDARNPNLMMFDSAPLSAQVDALLHPNSPLWRPSPSQVSTLFSKCTKSHPLRNNPVSGGGGSSGGGGGGFWLYSPIYGLTTPIGPEGLGYSYRLDNWRHRLECWLGRPAPEVSGGRMAKLYAVVFGAVGYLIVVWYYTIAFAPVRSDIGRTLLWYGCVICTNVTTLNHPARLRGALAFIGPLNALLYGAVGYIIGKAIHRTGAR